MGLKLAPRDLAVLFAQDATRVGISQSDRMTENLTALYASSGRGLPWFSPKGESQKPAGLRPGRIR